jgi:hypothetical protein
MQIRTAILAGVVALSAPLANGTPVYTSFGSLPGANFGGTGIPNDAVAKTEVWVNGTQQIQLALTAHARYSNTPVTNNGAGEYYAGPGQNCGVVTDPVGCPSASQGALWNFALYINTTNSTLADYTFTLYYDFDPGANTLLVDLGTVNLNNAIIGAGGNPAAMTNFQDSQNLLFSSFATAVPFVVDTPTLASFNPNAIGEYNFYLGFTANNIPSFAGIVGIDMNVVPVPAAVWLFGSGLGLLGWLRRRASA